MESESEAVLSHEGEQVEPVDQDPPVDQGTTSAPTAVEGQDGQDRQDGLTSASAVGAEVEGLQGEEGREDVGPQDGQDGQQGQHEEEIKAREDKKEDRGSDGAPSADQDLASASAVGAGEDGLESKGEQEGQREQGEGVSERQEEPTSASGAKTGEEGEGEEGKAGEEGEGEQGKERVGMQDGANEEALGITNSIGGEELRTGARQEGEGGERDRAAEGDERTSPHLLETSNDVGSQEQQVSMDASRDISPSEQLEQGQEQEQEQEQELKHVRDKLGDTLTSRSSPHSGTKVSPSLAFKFVLLTLLSGPWPAEAERCSFLRTDGRVGSGGAGAGPRRDFDTQEEDNAALSQPRPGAFLVSPFATSSLLSLASPLLFHLFDSASHILLSPALPTRCLGHPSRFRSRFPFSFLSFLRLLVV